MIHSTETDRTSRAWIDAMQDVTKIQSAMHSTTISWTHMESPTAGSGIRKDTKAMDQKRPTAL